MIKIDHTKDNIANVGWQYAYIEVEADGYTCKMIVSTPTLEGEALQKYCDAREEEYQLAVIRAMYPYDSEDEVITLDNYQDTGEKVLWEDMW